MRPVIRRVTAGFGGNAVGQAVQLAIQLLSLPLFLSHWDAATYGTWLVLSAIPVYVQMADVGMLTAAGNRMTMAMGRLDVQEARSVLHSALAFLGIVCGVAAVVALPLILWLPLEPLLDGDRRLALAILVVGVLQALLFGGVAEAIMRSTGRYAQGTALLALVQLAGWLGQAAGLVVSGSFSAVALGGFIVQCLGYGWVLALAQRDSQGLTIGLSQARLDEIRSLVKPALSFMAFPLSNALNLQGITLLVAQLLGPVAVAAFNTSRTLMRVVVQSTALLSHALWPEFSRLYGLGGSAAVAQLYRRAWLFGGVLGIAAGLVVYAAAPWLLEVWTRGVIAFDASLMGVLLVYAVVASVWHVPRVLLMATNQHTALAKWSLGCAVLGIALAAALGRFGPTGFALAMLLSELLMAGACIALARRSLRS